MLFTLVSYICAAKYSSNHIINYVDDTTVMANDVSAYREEIEQLTIYLTLYADKMKELLVLLQKELHGL